MFPVATRCGILSPLLMTGEVATKGKLLPYYFFHRLTGIIQRKSTRDDRHNNQRLRADVPNTLCENNTSTQTRDCTTFNNSCVRPLARAKKGCINAPPCGAGTFGALMPSFSIWTKHYNLSNRVDVCLRAREGTKSRWAPKTHSSTPSHHPSRRFPYFP